MVQRAGLDGDREAQGYARSLADALRQQGSDAWMDDRIDPGARVGHDRRTGL